MFIRKGDKVTKGYRLMSAGKGQRSEDRRQITVNSQQVVN
jgi:hypothetical protein